MDASPKVLCVDDDRDIAEVLQAILTDEGYQVSFLYDTSDDSLPRAVGRLEPDVVLLDSSSSVEYGEGWQLAAGLGARRRPIPVVMFTAHARDADEARAGTSQRAQDAGFTAIVAKPFDLDELLAAVALAAGRSTPFDRSQRGENRRTKELVAALNNSGATAVKPSTLREWALFNDAAGNLLQLYWWQLRGAYQVGRYRENGDLEMIGQFFDRDLAIEMALRGGGGAVPSVASRT